MAAWPGGTDALDVYLEDGDEPPPRRGPGRRLLEAWRTLWLDRGRAPAPVPPPTGRAPPWPAEEDPWRRGGRPWPDLSVRRLVPGDAAGVGAALGRHLGAAGLAVGAGVATGAGRLALRGGPFWAGAESRIPAVLRPRHGVRGVAVELVVAPWSSTRTEIALQVVGGRRLRRPGRRYFEAAHAVADRLQALLGARDTPAPA